MAFRRLGIALILMGWVGLGMAGAASSATGNNVTLIWTSPGDDGINGTATRYDIRYSMNLPITEDNFLVSAVVPGPPLPNESGSLQLVVVRDIVPGAVYYFAMKTVDERGNWSPISNVILYAAQQAVSASDAPVPLAFAPPAPNPALHSMRFELSLPQAAPVQVEAFDLSGRRVRSLLNGMRQAGRADVTWNLRDDQGLPVQAGIYLVRAVLPGKVVTHRAVVVR